MTDRKLINSKARIFSKLKKLLSLKSEIIFCYIHGSFLYPLVSPLIPRDIDVAIYVDSARISSDNAFEYSFQLSIDISSCINREVDVHILNYASLGFRHSVFRNGKLLFSKDEALRSDIIENTTLEYVDFYELSLQYIRDIV
jgi:predicted nucleotidyltransferase